MAETGALACLLGKAGSLSFTSPPPTQILNAVLGWYEDMKVCLPPQGRSPLLPSSRLNCVPNASSVAEILVQNGTVEWQRWRNGTAIQY